MIPQISNSATGLYTDLYQLAMGEAYFKKNQHRSTAQFDYFFRTLPFSGGYVIFCGLDDVLNGLETLRFNEEDLLYLKKQGFSQNYLNYLKDFRFSGQIRSVCEGEIVFPFAPIVSVCGNILECQLVETFLLNTLNFQSLIATKAARIATIAKGKLLSEYGLRRAQSFGGLSASRASFIGGFHSTSNVLAGYKYNIPISGTMAHAYVQAHENELNAFRNFAETRPNNCVLLVDTYNTLKSGIPNAIIVAKEMEKRGQKLLAIRLDSGDLSYLSKQARQMLDYAGLSYVKIAASNQLDELLIRSLQQQGATIDMYGVGTDLVVGKPDAALDGVYKLSIHDGIARIKISDNLKKMNLPGNKQIYRYKDNDGFYLADAITQIHLPAPMQMVAPFEPHKSMNLDAEKAQPLLREVMHEGKRILNRETLSDIQKYVQKSLALLPEEHKRFDYPHVYRVGISRSLESLRDSLRNQKMQIL